MELSDLRRLTDSVIDISENTTFFSGTQGIQAEGSSVTITAPESQSILLTNLFASVETKRITVEIDDVVVSTPSSLLSKTFDWRLTGFRIGAGGTLDAATANGDIIPAKKIKITAGDGTATIYYSYVFVNNPKNTDMAFVKSAPSLIPTDKFFPASSSSITITAPAGKKVLLSAAWVVQGGGTESGIEIRRDGILVHNGTLVEVDGDTRHGGRFIIGESQYLNSAGMPAIKGNSITIAKESGVTGSDITYKYTFVEDK